MFHVKRQAKGYNTARPVSPVNQPISGPLILRDTDFVGTYTPPDYLIDDFIQKGYLYSITGPTGHGKTPITLLAGLRVAQGKDYHGHPVTQGGVLFLAGENSDDIRARYIAMLDKEGVQVGSIPFYFIDGIIDINAEMPRIMAEVGNIPNLSLVIIDTDQAYFQGDEGNSNEQRKKFAQILRQLLKLPGRPAALVNCHPKIGATPDNLVPIGGSSFLNEIDGNIMCWAEDRTCTIKPHPNKWRGVAFESMAFEAPHHYQRQAEGQQGPAYPVRDGVPDFRGRRQATGGSRRRGRKDSPSPYARRQAFVAGYDRHVGRVAAVQQQPAKSKVDRILTRLKASKFVYRYHGEKYRLTKKGCKHIGVNFGGAEDDEE